MDGIYRRKNENGQDSWGREKESTAKEKVEDKWKGYKHDKDTNAAMGLLGSQC